MVKKFVDEVYQMDNDKQKVSDHHGARTLEEREKMNRSPFKYCGVGAEPMADEVTVQNPAPAKMNRSPLKYCGVDAKPMADEETVQNPAPAIRTCNICGKTFSNGKALGGHRRSHFEARRKEKGHSHKVKTRLPNHSKTTNKANCDETLVSDGKHTCYLCNKDFPSKNALFGHMRSHPERDWRGVLPPMPSDKHSSCSPNSDSMEQINEDDDYVDKVVAPNEPAIDLSKYFPSWHKTDKRGRTSIEAEAAQNIVYLSRREYFRAEHRELLQADNLMKASVESPGVPMPCKNRKIGESPTSEKHVKKIKVYRSGSLKLANKTDDDGECDSDKQNGGKGLSDSRDEKILVNMDDEEEKDEEDANWGKEEYCVKNIEETSDGMNTEVTHGKMQDHVGHFDDRKVMMKKKKKRKKLLLKIKTEGSKSEDNSFLHKTLMKPDGYKCGCGKSFPTFQALGGHRSIHKKDKNISAMDESRPSDAIVAEDNSCPSHLQQMNETKESKVRGLLMEAADKVVSETFATAGALDDHNMRCYSTGTPLSEEASDHMMCYSTGFAGTPLSEEASANEAGLSHPMQEMEEASESGPKILDIDLNEPYVMQDEATKSIGQA